MTRPAPPCPMTPAASSWRWRARMCACLAPSRTMLRWAGWAFKLLHFFLKSLQNPWGWVFIVCPCFEESPAPFGLGMQTVVGERAEPGTDSTGRGAGSWLAGGHHTLQPCPAQATPARWPLPIPSSHTPRPPPITPTPTQVVAFSDMPKKGVHSLRWGPNAHMLLVGAADHNLRVMKAPGA